MRSRYIKMCQFSTSFYRFSPRFAFITGNVNLLEEVLHALYVGRQHYDWRYAVISRESRCANAFVMRATT